MLDQIKLALRIQHNYLDEDIITTIKAAQRELLRLGLDIDMVENPDELVIRAIITYCQAVYSPDMKVREGYEKSFSYQVDCLRKSDRYNV